MLHCPEAAHQAIKVDLLGCKADLYVNCVIMQNQNILLYGDQVYNDGIVDKQRGWKAIRLAHGRDIATCHRLHNDTFQSALLIKDTLLVDDSP